MGDHRRLVRPTRDTVHLHVIIRYGQLSTGNQPLLDSDYEQFVTIVEREIERFLKVLRASGQAENDINTCRDQFQSKFVLQLIIALCLLLKVDLSN